MTFEERLKEVEEGIDALVAKRRAKRRKEAYQRLLDSKRHIRKGKDALITVVAHRLGTYSGSRV